MKNPFFSASFFVFFLLSNTFLYSQTNQATNQPNQATIFELTDSNVSTVAAQVHQLLQNKAEYPGFPSPNELKIYLEEPFASPHLIFDPSACPKPGLRAYENAQGQICFRFDNLSNSVNGNLVVGRLDYSDPTFPNFFITYGTVLNTGINLPEKDLHCQIFVIGYLCPPANPNGPQVANKFEILIVDKNIL